MKGYKCKGGTAFETKHTPQSKLNGKKRSGDGTVPYASLSYCTHWAGQGVKVKVDEIEGAEHRAILKDKTFTRLVIEYICLPSFLSTLPDSFKDVEYDVWEIDGTSKAERILCLNKKSIDLKTKNHTLVGRFNYTNLQKVGSDAKNHLFSLRFRGQKITFFSKKTGRITQELAVRCKFLEHVTASKDEPRDEFGQTELHRVCFEGDLDRVMELVDEDRGINAQDNNGWTPLLVAVSRGHLHVALFFLKLGETDHTIIAKDGTTILHLLARLDPQLVGEDRFDDVLNAAARLRLPVNSRGKAQETPLHEAVRHGKTKMIKWLILHNANINAADESGNTPLHRAIEMKHRAIVQILLQNGADKHILNNRGVSPLNAAGSVDQESMILIRDFRFAGFKAAALFDFDPVYEGDLAFKVKDVITNCVEDSDHPGWLFGELNGKKGFVPSDFVKRIPRPVAIPSKV